MAKFVTEVEAEELAIQAIKDYIKSCRCQSRNDAALAVQKMVGMSMLALQAVENGTMETVQ